MVYTAFNAPLYWPRLLRDENSLSIQGINTIGHYVAVVCRAPVTDTITKVLFRVGSINAGDLDIRIETVDSSGLPSGTLWGTNTNIVRTFLASEDNTAFEVTLTSAASVNRGENFAIVLKANTTSFGDISMTNQNLIASYPSRVTFTGTASSSQNNTLIAPVYGTAGYINSGGLFAPWSGAQRVDLTTTSNPRLAGQRLNPDMDYRTSGFWVQGDFDSGTVTATLYSSDGATALKTATFESYTFPNTGFGTLVLPWSSSQDLTAGQGYILAFSSSGGAGSASFARTNFLNSGAKEIYVGTTSYATTTVSTPTSISDWTFSDTAYLACGLLLEGADIPTGGGGGLAANPLGGFLR